MGFTTRSSLLRLVGRNDEFAWREFYTKYSPLVRLRGRDHGLDLVAREELVQAVMLEFFKNGAASRFDKEKGRFRDLLRTIVDRRSIDILRKQWRTPKMCGAEALRGIPSQEENSPCQEWEDEWRENLLRQAFAELKAKIEPVNFQAFELYAIKRWNPKDVAAFLGIAVASVYLAKSRCIAALGEMVAELDED